MTLVGSELLSRGNNRKVLTISNKNSALTRRYIYFSVISIINIDIGSDIKDKVL